MDAEKLAGLTARRTKKPSKILYGLALIGLGAGAFIGGREVIRESRLPTLERLAGRFSVESDGKGQYLTLEDSDRRYFLGKVIPRRGDTINDYIRRAFSQSRVNFNPLGPEADLASILLGMHGLPKAEMPYTTVVSVEKKE